MGTPMGNNPENLATMTEQLVDMLDKCQTTARLDVLAKIWKRLRPTFSDEQNEEIRKAAMRALATVDDETPEEPTNAEDDVEIGGVMTIEEVEAEEREKKNGDDILYE